MSLSTAKAVTQALNFDKYDIIPVFITREGEWRVGDQLKEPAQSIEQLAFTREEASENDVSEFFSFYERKQI